MLSGPHQTPFLCKTERVGLGPALDADCSAAPKVQWFARTSGDQAFHELADPFGPYPADTVLTETSDGAAVPFVVRVESRDDQPRHRAHRRARRPARREDADAPFAADRWNGRVYHAFGESCGVGYDQGRNSTDTVLGNVDLTNISGDNLLINLIGITDRLGKGDITMHSTLTAFGVHCNPLVSVETLMMIKEHIAEQYGRVPEIVGTNGSGAALQQYINPLKLTCRRFLYFNPSAFQKGRYDSVGSPNRSKARDCVCAFHTLHTPLRHCGFALRVYCKVN